MSLWYATAVSGRTVGSSLDRKVFLDSRILNLYGSKCHLTSPGVHRKANQGRSPAPAGRRCMRVQIGSVRSRGVLHAAAPTASGWRCRTGGWQTAAACHPGASGSGWRRRRSSSPAGRPAPWPPRCSCCSAGGRCRVSWHGVTCDGRVATIFCYVDGTKIVSNCLPHSGIAVDPYHDGRVSPAGAVCVVHLLGSAHNNSL